MKMSEPDRKRRKYQTEHSVNPGPGPPLNPISEVTNQDTNASDQTDYQDDWKCFHVCVENLHQYLITRCICPWRQENYQNVLISSGNKCSDAENHSEILLFCSAVQLLCEEIARQNSVVARNDGYCRTLKHLKVLLFHVNSVSDPTCLLQQFLRSPNQYVSFAAARALSAWLKAADEGACRVLLDRLLENIITPLATSLSTLNTSGIHGPLPHTVSNLLDILKSCIETPDIEPHPTEGATEDEEEDTNYESQDRASHSKFVCQGSFNIEELSEDSTSADQSDAESSDLESKDLKGSVIRALGKHWNVIVTYFHAALTLAQSATNLHSEDIFLDVLILI